MRSCSVTTTTATTSTAPAGPAPGSRSGPHHRCRARRDGPTLQDAADDLVQCLLTYAMAVRSSVFRVSPELGPPDLAAMNLLDQLGEIAAVGGDIRTTCSADPSSEHL
jgi:hypothetical protein